MNPDTTQGENGKKILSSSRAWILSNPEGLGFYPLRRRSCCHHGAMPAVAALHQCDFYSRVTLLALGGCHEETWRQLEIPAERETRKCSAVRELFILLQRNHRALVGNLALSPGISYVWGFPEITGPFSERMTVSSKWIYWISENKIKR